MSVNITDGQIEAFAKALVNNGIIEKSDIEENKTLIEESLKLSLSRDGMPVVVYNYTDRIGSEFTKTPAMNAQFPEQELTKAIRDPQEIFLFLYHAKRNEEKAKEDQQHKLLDEALMDWYYYDQKTPATERYNPSLGTRITRDYFIENPYKCKWQAAGCHMRFKTPEDAQRHRYQHGG
jgi:hypothetical protein